MNYSKTILVGRVGRDPEMKVMPNGNAVTTFSIAVGRSWKDENKNVHEETEWNNIVFYGKPAEILAQYLKKGALLLVEGRLKTQTWEKDGVKHYRTEIVGEAFQFAPKSSKNGEADDWGSEATPPKRDESPNHPDPKKRSVLPEYSPEDINPEDIPF